MAVPRVLCEPAEAERDLELRLDIATRQLTGFLVRAGKSTKAEKLQGAIRHLLENLLYWTDKLTGSVTSMDVNLGSIADSKKRELKFFYTRTWSNLWQLKGTLTCLETVLCPGQVRSFINWSREILTPLEMAFHRNEKVLNKTNIDLMHWIASTQFTSTHISDCPSHDTGRTQRSRRQGGPKDKLNKKVVNDRTRQCYWFCRHVFDWKPNAELTQPAN